VFSTIDKSDRKGVENESTNGRADEMCKCYV